MAKKGEVVMGSEGGKKKIFFIVGVVLLVLLVAGLLYFGKGRTAGRAIYTGAGTEGTGGYEGTYEGLTAGSNPFVFKVGANLGTKNSVAYSFKLNYPADKYDVDVAKDISLGYDWGDNAFKKVTVENGVISVDYATLDFTKAITGSKILATITFHLKQGAGVLTVTDITNKKLDFVEGSFKVLDLDSKDGAGNIITKIMQPSGEAVGGAVPAGGGVPGGVVIPVGAVKETECNGANMEWKKLNVAVNDVKGIAIPVGGSACVCTVGFLNLNGKFEDGCEAQDLSAVWDKMEYNQKKELCDKGVCQVPQTLDQMWNALGIEGQKVKCKDVINCAGITSDIVGVDLNNDGKIDNDDVFILQLARLAEISEPQANCGKENEPMCEFDNYYVCENMYVAKKMSTDKGFKTKPTCGSKDYFKNKKNGLKENGIPNS